MRAACALFSLLCFALLRCGIPPLAGGTTDTGNQMVVATICTPDGGRAAGAIVIVRPASYLKPFALPKSAAIPKVIFTDDTGRFVIDSLPAGDYCIEVNDRVSSAVLLKVAIGADSAGQHVLRDTLKPYAGVEGSIGQEPRLINYAQVYGLERCVVVSASGLFSIPDLPRATFDIRIASTDTAFTPVEIKQVACVPGVVTRLPLATWKHSRRIGLNTSASGAGVSATITGFPVLVRLNAGNFDFTQARDNGADIRFVKPDLTLLPYEIERWDPAAGFAEIWVRLDTVRGNSADQNFLMYWGNPNAPAQSAGARVFDTASGFQGVWHLDEKSGTVDDATYGGHNGSRIGNQAQTPGVIGFGQAFIDSGDYSDMGDALNPGNSNFTISAWIKRSDTGGVRTVAGKTYGDTLLQPDYGWLLALNLDYVRLYVASSGTRWGDAGTFFCESSIKITDQENWHYICAVVDKSRSTFCKLFVDGVDVTKTRLGDISRVGGLSNTLPLRIGIEADNDYPLKGYVDELVVSYAAHSADWVKLCYMNQKPEDHLVEFK
jgi:hypothetical protein